MTYLKIIVIALLSTSCSLFQPKVKILKQKDINTYKSDGSNSNDCLSMSEKSCELFKEVNSYRHRKNLPPLLAQENCIDSAKAHSENMYKQEKLKHNLSNSQWVDRIKIHGAVGELMAENVALASSPKQVIAKWIKSKFHRDNMENKKFTHMGIGEKGRYWTQCFLKKFER